MAGVRRALEAGQSVLLVAPAGLGKSTVVAQVLAGRPVRRAETHAGGRAAPLAPLVEAIGPELSGSPQEVAAQVLARTEGHALLVEDLHWADPATLAVLRVLAPIRPRPDDRP